jgi:Ser/Thr protein kinase RdoA (MazF antagonist)
VLNERELIDLLQRHALLTPAEVLDGDFKITRVDRRNQNYRVESDGERDLFIKQGSTAAAIGSMAQEAAVYELLAKPPIDQHAGKYLTRYLGHDPSARVLILRALPGAEDLHEYHLRTRRFPTRLASELGSGLGTLHRATRFLADARPDARSVSPVRPWVCGLPSPELGLLREASAINLKLIRMLQKEPAFAREFAELSSEWRTESLIHGDVKLDNCLTYRARPKNGTRGLKLVDWEFAGLGDPRWDVASVFSGYLALWVFSIPMPRPERPDLKAGDAQFPLTTIKSTLRSFFESYVDAAALSPATIPAWLQTAVRMAGARLVQSAYEYAAGASELFAPVLTLLQLALNVLKRPERAAADLLGIQTASQTSSLQPEPARG